MDFAVPADHRVKIRAMEHEGDGDTSYCWSTWNGS